jgi:hypothetical protein
LYLDSNVSSCFNAVDIHSIPICFEVDGTGASSHHAAVRKNISKNGRTLLVHPVKNQKFNNKAGLSRE